MMRWELGSLAIGVISLAVTSMARVDGETSAQTRATAPLAKNLQPVSNFAADDRAHSIALFTEAGKVLQHPRCLNRHPASERPTQADWMRGAFSFSSGMPCTHEASTRAE